MNSYHNSACCKYCLTLKIITDAVCKAIDLHLAEASDFIIDNNDVAGNSSKKMYQCPNNFRRSVTWHVVKSSVITFDFKRCLVWICGDSVSDCSESLDCLTANTGVDNLV